jgi:hypothetical protein
MFSHPSQVKSVCCTGSESPTYASTPCMYPTATATLASEAAAACSDEARSAMAHDTLKTIEAQEAELRAVQANAGSGCRTSARRQCAVAQKLNDLQVCHLLDLSVALCSSMESKHCFPFPGRPLVLACMLAVCFLMVPT